MERRSASDLLLRSVLIAFAHHQLVDMSGYPRVEEKRPQNLLSEIVAIADCYDAMTHPSGLPAGGAEAPGRLAGDGQEQWHSARPDALRVFISTVGLYPVGSLVTLDSNERGLVHSVNPEPRYTDRPLVKLFTDPGGGVREPQAALSLSKGGPATKIVDLTEVDETTGQFTRHIVDCVLPTERSGRSTTTSVPWRMKKSCLSRTGWSPSPSVARD